MSKINLVEVLTLLIFFLLPGIAVVLRIFDSYAGGMSIVLVILSVKYLISYKIRISNGNLNIVIICLLLFFLQYINHVFAKNDLLKTLIVSIILPTIYYICEKFYFQICNRENFIKIIKIVSYITIFLIFLGVLYYERGDASNDVGSSQYRLFIVNEPSHVPAIFGPLIICFVFLSKDYSSIYMRLTIVSFLTLLLGTATGVILLLLLFFTLFRIHKFFLLLLFLFCMYFFIRMLNIQSIDYLLDLILERAVSFFEVFNRENYIGLNLSTIVFIQGYEFIWDTIVRLDFLGVGSGNGMFHIMDYPAFNANIYYHGDKQLNVSDPGFMLSKIILEYGLLFGSLYLIAIYKLSKYFFLVRNRILNYDYDHIDIIYVGCFLTTLVNCFFRGGGYIHHSMFYFFLSIIIYIYRNDRKKK